MSKFPDFSMDETAFLLEEYNLNKDQVGPKKKFFYKKDLWGHISQRLEQQFGSEFTPNQCSSRFINVNRAQNKASAWNAKSGYNQVEVSFEKEYLDLKNKDDSVEPEILMSARSVQVMKEVQNKSATKKACKNGN